MKKEYKKFWNESQDEMKEITRNRSKIVNSFCPHIYGMFLVKLATLMIVIGGSDMRKDVESSEFEFEFEEEESTGVRKNRREGHLLLVGDPGKQI